MFVASRFEWPTYVKPLQKQNTQIVLFLFLSIYKKQTVSSVLTFCTSYLIDMWVPCALIVWSQSARLPMSPQIQFCGHWFQGLLAPDGQRAHVPHVGAHHRRPQQHATVRTWFFSFFLFSIFPFSIQLVFFIIVTFDICTHAVHNIYT